MARSVVVYEDYDLLRDSIVRILSLSERFEVKGAFGNVLQIEEQVNALQPECILMDIEMPGRTGIEAVVRLRKSGITIPVIILTVFDDNEHVFAALEGGATGYLLKKHISTKLNDAIDEVLNGGSPMSPAIARMVINSMQRAGENPYNLTKRETEILSSLAQGNSYKMVADNVSVSVETVRSHIKKIYEKLHVHSQTEAVLKAVRERLV